MSVGRPATGFLTASAFAFGLAACGGGNGGGNDPDPVLQSITLASGGSVVAGATIQGTATLSATAKTGGASVVLTSSNPGVATVPGSVPIAEGSTSATFTVTGVAAGSVTITGTFGGPRTANVTVTAPPINASFQVVPDANTIATGDQCEVQSVSGANLMKCTFNASGSTPQNAITSYIWRFPTTNNNIQTITQTTPTLANVSLPCGSFGTGAVGTVAGRDVTLEIVTPGGNDEVMRTVTFIRNGPCG
jgi:hypothetical protein